MGNQKYKALQAEGRSMWVKPINGSQNKESRLFLYDHYVLGCPLPHVSGAVHAAPVFQHADNQRAAAQYDTFLSDVCNYTNKDLGQIAKWLIDNKHAGSSVPNIANEFACFALPPVGILKDAYGLYANIKKAELRAIHRKPYEALLRLDALFRHLRNSFAHGLFSIVQRKSPQNGKRESFVYCQDNNSSGQITARMFLSLARLKRIVIEISDE